eukprot:m.79066 g.79066  ORF g.79066 m.79066 type:complete len:125 (-) comp14611_c1_seq2:35-409(-)
MDDDAELAALRAQRMAEMQQSGPSQQEQREADQQRQSARNSMLSQILDQAARARLSNLAVVKPDKARAVEDMLMRMAQGGQIRGKVTELQFKDMLEQVSAKFQKKTTVNFRRRPVDSDSDSDDD